MDLNDYFYYDETSPTCLRHKAVKYCRKREGESTGQRKSHGYYLVTAGGVTYKAHRVIYELLVGKIPEGMQIDHVDRDRSNNRFENLRLVCSADNMRNKVKQSNNTSGVTGVCLIKTASRARADGSIPAYWQAKWHDLSKNRCTKMFSIDTLGYDEAFRLACEYRAKMITELNEQGAGYSENHGTEFTPYYDGTSDKVLLGKLLSSKEAE